MAQLLFKQRFLLSVPCLALLWFCNVYHFDVVHRYRPYVVFVFALMCLAACIHERTVMQPCIITHKRKPMHTAKSAAN